MLQAFNNISGSRILGSIWHHSLWCCPKRLEDIPHLASWRSAPWCGCPRGTYDTCVEPEKSQDLLEALSQVGHKLAQGLGCEEGGAAGSKVIW